MELLAGSVDFVLHIDKHLAEIVQEYGVWTYLGLFMIIFCETGLVITPFLPGDSLLFVIGALGASNALDLKLTLILLGIAAIGGNTLNYFIGRIIGDKILNSENIRLIKKEHIEKTQVFYQKHGGKAIILSRFLPILRTFAPFVAGIGKMQFSRFLIYNAVGGGAWVLIFMLSGYLFGNIPAVKDNFSYVAMLIIFVSLIPVLIANIRTLKSSEDQKNILLLENEE